MDYAQMTTDALIAYVSADTSVTERELHLLDRLTGAIAEIESLARSLDELRLHEMGDADA